MEQRMVPYVVTIERELGEDEMAVPLVPSMMIAWSDPLLWTAVILIILHPIYWLLVIHWERRTRALTRLCRDNYCSCFFFALSTLSFSIYKIFSFRAAVQNQLQCWFLRHNGILWCGHFFFIFGAICVIFAYRALGFFTAFYGDYFGLLLPARVRTFPYTLMNHPIYMGGFMMFLGYALIFASQVGIFLSILIFIMYHIAIFFESAFTDRIYGAVERKYGRRDEYDGLPMVEDEVVEYRVDPRNGARPTYVTESRVMSSPADGIESQTETVTVIKRRGKPRTVVGAGSVIEYTSQPRVRVTETHVEHVSGPLVEQHFETKVNHTAPEMQLVDSHIEYTSGPVIEEHFESKVEHGEQQVDVTESHVKHVSGPNTEEHFESTVEHSVQPNCLLSNENTVEFKTDGQIKDDEESAQKGHSESS